MRSGLELSLVVDLTADLAGWMVRRVDVDVGHARPDGLNDRSEVAGCDSLARRANDIGGVNGPRHHRLAGCAGRAGGLAPTAPGESGNTSPKKTTPGVGVGGSRGSRRAGGWPRLGCECG